MVLFKVVSYKLSLMKMLGQVIEFSNCSGIESIIVTLIYIQIITINKTYIYRGKIKYKYMTLITSTSLHTS